MKNGASSVGVTIQPSTSTPELHLKEMKTHIHTKTSTWMFTPVLSIEPKSRNPTCIKWWRINKMWYINTMEYYLTKKTMIHAITWLNVENKLKWKEVRHKRSHIEWFHLHDIFKVGETTEPNSSCQELEKGKNRKWLLTGNGFLFGV